MRKFLLIFALMVGLTSCEKEETETTPLPEEPTPQMTLMYFCGTHLSSYYTKNISAAAEAVADGALGNGRLLYYKPSSSSAGALYELVEVNGKSSSELIKSYTSSPSLDGDVMRQVINDAKAYAEAEVYNLVVSSHGTGWVYSSHPYLRSAVDGSSTYESGSTVFQPTYTDYVTRFLGNSTDGYMEISELKSALDSTGEKFGYIIFDACFMASIEALYDLRECSSYILASPCEMMGDGLPYSVVIPELFEQNGAYADLVGACEAFYDYNVENVVGADSRPVACISICDMSEMDALAEATRAIYMNNPNTVSDSNLQYYDGRTDHVFYDFEQYLKLLSADDDLTAQFVEQFDKTFPAEGRIHTDYFYSIYNTALNAINYYSGVTTSDPSTKFQSEWEATAWAIAVGAN